MVMQERHNVIFNLLILLPGIDQLVQQNIHPTTEYQWSYQAGIPGSHSPQESKPKIEILLATKFHSNCQDYSLFSSGHTLIRSLPHTEHWLLVWLMHVLFDSCNGAQNRRLYLMTEFYQQNLQGK